jgi:hypothetical protein
MTFICYSFVYLMGWSFARLFELLITFKVTNYSHGVCDVIMYFKGSCPLVVYVQNIYFLQMITFM